jgi:hypothetical protein
MGGGSTISLSKIYALVVIVGLGRVNGYDARGMRLGSRYRVLQSSLDNFDMGAITSLTALHS